MTEPQDSGTRPISVAELLAKNGTIGSPPVGGRRRRRRGNADSVTVAELTGEIPIIRATDTVETVAEPRQSVEAEPQPVSVDEDFADLADDTDLAVDDVEVDGVEVDGVEVDDAAVEVEVDETDAEVDETAATEVDEAEADYAAHLQARDVEPEPIEFTPPTRRPTAPAPTGFTSPGGAEQMSPDPLFDDDLSPSDDDIDRDLAEIASGAAEVRESQGFEPAPSLLRSNSDTLFGGQSVADDLARRGRQPGPEDIDLGEDQRDDETTKLPAETVSETTGSAFLRGVWVVAQCILAVAFGAALFIAFDQLWKWNNIVALVLSVLVILGLVVGVRVVRKTEDIGSTLIAVAVGALVTLGPLALLQSH
ncbi:hypothetical protein [Mycolicibacterium sp. YH-1]|uniref:hypothetical protein n=1 Tax=Mycolicibacterium sp. YH-1 TaxID=2908837 RepID=UPI001F4BFFAA|nr:hypothetical protein [Mycolicibacterium sp. YH-1]UNB51726.1 hypothetical protein L0M16_28105 [Mycolicibacterium sp. YH-1]